MALLCANIDPSSIQLLGRWKSDTMIRYLRVFANPQNTTNKPRKWSEADKPHSTQAPPINHSKRVDLMSQCFSTIPKLRSHSGSWERERAEK
jgi:hypothetical protein